MENSSSIGALHELFLHMLVFAVDFVESRGSLYHPQLFGRVSIQFSSLNE